MDLHLADRNAVQIHGSAIGERGGVGHVGVDDDLVFKDIGLAGDQKNEHRQDGHGEDRQDPHFESRPGGPVLNRHKL